MVSGTKDGEGKVFKFATLSIVGQNIPIILAVEPVRESSEWDDNPPNQIHRVVRKLVRQAQEHLPIETVLCDAEFDSKNVYQTLSNLGVNYLIPKRTLGTEREAIDTMEADGQDVAVESVSVHVTHGSHAMRFLYVPSTNEVGQQCLQRTYRSVLRRLKRSVNDIVHVGRLRMSTRASRTTS